MTQNSNGYDARQHLVQIRSKDGTMKDYLPANWRLYQARLEHPDIVLESEIIHMDVEHNFVIVKALVFVGTDYASATLKCSAMKQGLLSALDKVETAAKARALRDLGISTELALDHDDDETPTIAPQRPTAGHHNGTSNPTDGPSAPVENEVRAQFEALYPDREDIWAYVIEKQFGKLPRWTPENIVKMKAYYLKCEEHERSRQSEGDAA